MEQTVTAATGATTLQAGVTWGTSVTIGDVFYVNEFELMRLDTIAPEYQYHLKDHLGNVRVTFTTKDETQSATATYETANMASDKANFIRYDNARRVQSSLFDRTNGAATGYAQRLNGSANEKFGLARSISVMPGDRLNLEVYAKYVDTNPANLTTALATLMTQIANGTAPAGTVLDGSGYSSSTSSFPFAGLLSTAGSTGGPKAYLNYILFDRSFNYKTGGYKRLSATPIETGTDVAHERLFFDNLTISEPGYIYIYLSNEETTNVEVFFDDFKVEHIKAPIVSAQDYYPFGLTFNSYERENSIPNQYEYNGKELQEELSIGWLDYGARMYLPEIGRWGVADPLADKYPAYSPYNYVLNNPLKYIDPDGEDVYLIVWTTSDGNIGHAGVAIDNYKKDESGNFVKDKDGNYVKDGTVTYQDLWPGTPVGQDNADEDVKAAYGGPTITTVDDLMKTDVSGSEGYAPQGIVKLATSFETDQNVNKELEEFKGENASYNGVKCNCSDFAKAGVNATNPSKKVNGQEIIFGTFSTTPNHLFKETSKLENATILKDPGKNAENNFIEGVTQSQRKAMLGSYISILKIQKALKATH